MNFLNILTFATSAVLAVAVRSEPQLRASAERQLSVAGTPRGPGARLLGANNSAILLNGTDEGAAPLVREGEVSHRMRCVLLKEANH